MGQRLQGEEGEEAAFLSHSLWTYLINGPTEDNFLAYLDNWSPLGFFCHSFICFLGLELFACGIPVSSSGTGTQ